MLMGRSKAEAAAAATEKAWCDEQMAKTEDWIGIFAGIDSFGVHTLSYTRILAGSSYVHRKSPTGLAIAEAGTPPA